VVRDIDLNADVGEECGDDRALLALVTSANVATGAHAGGGLVLDETVRLAVQAGCAVGAHPSYRDREGFGRVSFAHAVAVDELITDVVEQILLVASACGRNGTPLRHVKAHGGLYNDAASDAAIARALVEAVITAQDRIGPEGLLVVGLSGSLLEVEAQARGVDFVREGFADRAYILTGALASRSQPGAVLTDGDRIRTQALAIAQGLPVETINGAAIVIEADSLCLHGDTPGAVEHARMVRAALEELGVRVLPVGPHP